jgi:hypothetical protein
VRLEGWDCDGFDGWDDIGMEVEGVQIREREESLAGGSDRGLVDDYLEVDLDMLIAVWL